MTAPAHLWRDASTLLEAALARTPIVLFAVDPDGRCTLSTGHGLGRLGLVEHELEGADLLAYYEDDPSARANLRRALAGHPAQYVWKRADGTVFDVWLEPVHDDDAALSGVVGVCVDATDRVRAEAAECDRAEVQRSVLHRVVQVQDAERRRMAAALHDDTVQVLAAAALRLGLAGRQLGQTRPEVATALADLAQEMTGAGTRLRRIVGGGEPASIDHRGLAPALGDLLARTFGGTSTATQLEASAGPLHETVSPVGPPAQALYLIAVEALANCRRHARASAVDVALLADDGDWVLRVVDDGAGLAATGGRTGYGLTAMQHRAQAAGGTLVVRSAPGGGTVVEARVPRRVGPSVDPTSSAVEFRPWLDHVLEGVTDAVLALDRDFTVVYLNRRAGEALGRSVEDLTGRGIWAEFPGAIGHAFHTASLRALAERRSIEVEEYFPPWRRWFVGRIFPSSLGLTLFMHDVTEFHDQASRLDASQTGQQLTQVWAEALSGEADLDLALAGAAQALVAWTPVRGVRVVLDGRQVVSGDGVGDRMGDGAVDEVGVVVAGRTVGRLAVAWAGQAGEWTGHLTSMLAATLAARLAPGAWSS